MSDCPCDRRNPGAYPESSLLRSIDVNGNMQSWWTNNWSAGGNLKDPYFCQYYCCTPGRGGGGGCPDSRSLARPDFYYFIRGISWYAHGHDGSLYVYQARDANQMFQDFKNAFCGANFSPPVITFPAVPTKQTIDPPFLLNITSTASESTSPISVASSDPTIAAVFGQKVVLGKGGNVTLTASQSSNCFPPAVESQSFLVYGITSLPSASNLIWGQPLGNSIITGGGANLPGVFSWTNPNIITNVGTFKYSVTFTPNDASWGPFKAKIPVTTTNIMITSLTNADKIGAIIASGESGPYTPSPSLAISGLNPDSLKGILHLSNRQYRNLKSINIKHLGIKDVYFLGRKSYVNNIFTGVVPSGLKFLDLTSNALTTEAIDGILVSMNENAKANKLSLGEIYLWGGSSGWNQFPSEIGYSARNELMSAISPKYSGIFDFVINTGIQTGALITLNGVTNHVSLTGTTASDNIASLINRSPPFSDFGSTYTVTRRSTNTCLFTRNSEGLANGSFSFAISGFVGLFPPIAGGFSTLGSGGKYHGNWSVGINRWMEINERINNVSLIQPSRNLVRTNSTKELQAYNINDNRTQFRYISRLKPGQTINIGLINYLTRGVSNLSFNSALSIVDANFLNQPIGSLLSFPILDSVRLGSTTSTARDGALGQTAYGHGLAYTSSNPFYRYSGCPNHSVECFTNSAFGGNTISSLLSPYPFDGNTVECPITCYTNQYGFDVLALLEGPAPSFFPPTVFVDDNIAYNVIRYQPGASCSYGNNLDPDMGRVCSERSIPRSHARII